MNDSKASADADAEKAIDERIASFWRTSARRRYRSAFSNWRGSCRGLSTSEIAEAEPRWSFWLLG